MFSNIGLHIIKNPKGTYSYAGTIPADLGMEHPASTSDVMGGRAYNNAAGNLVTLRFPVFPTIETAAKFAADRGHTARF